MRANAKEGKGFSQHLLRLVVQSGVFWDTQCKAFNGEPVVRQLCRNSCDLSPQAKSEADDKGRQRRPGGPQAQHVARSDIYLTMGRTRVEERGANLCLLEMSRKTGTDIHTDRQFF